MMVMVGDFPG